MHRKWLAFAVAFVTAGLLMAPADAGFFKDLFGGGQSGRSYYPEQVPKNRAVPSRYRRQTVNFRSSEDVGTIVIDTRAHYLYYVLSNRKAVRYGVGTGRRGFDWKGAVKISRKAEWPSWTPPREMVERERKRGIVLPAQMKGGKNNPLGARALYLYEDGQDTGYRIHGTSEPWTIGLNVSSGCIRLVNEDVVDLYNRAKVIVR